MTTDKIAVEQRFLGSPTVRINGVDIDPYTSGRDDYGLSSRLHQTDRGPVGKPPDGCPARCPLRNRPGRQPPSSGYRTASPFNRDKPLDGGRSATSLICLP